MHLPGRHEFGSVQRRGARQKQTAQVLGRPLIDREQRSAIVVADQGHVATTGGYSSEHVKLPA